MRTVTHCRWCNRRFAPCHPSIADVPPGYCSQTCRRYSVRALAAAVDDALAPATRGRQ